MMNVESHSNWLSAYLYYQGPLDEMLRQLVNPFIHDVYGKCVNQYFFIRYYENGPHIRLRLKGDEYALEKIAKPKLMRVAGDFFSKALKVRKCSIQFSDYKPELDRYGGLKGTRIAEKLFQVSSNITLKIVSNEEWNFQKALGAALQLNIILLYLFFEDIEEIKKFVRFEHHNWLAVSVDIDRGDEARQSMINHLISEQDKSYQKQRGHIHEVLINIWSKLKKGEAFGDKKMDQWKIAVEEIALEFKYNQTEIISNSALACNDSFGQIDYSLKKWLILDSYIHLTNNRLGLLYKDESYTYYILKEFFLERF